MFRWSQKLLITAVVAAMSLCWVGCSDDNDVVVSSYNPNQISGVESFFPLTSGYQTVYAVHDINGYDYTMTNRISGIDSSRGFHLARQVSHTGNTVDTGFFYVGSDAILYFDYPAATPEKFLQAPLTSGNTWNRFPTLADDFTNILAEWDKGNNSNSRTIPTEGSSQLTVVGVDFVSLKAGSSYSHAVKIVNIGSDGTNNAYWFAPGVGLVKYILGVSHNDPTTGNVVGELVSFDQF